MFKESLLALIMLAVAMNSSAGEDSHRGPRFKVEEIPNSNGDATCNEDLRTNTFARRVNDRGFAVGTTDCFVATGDPAFPFQDRGPKGFAWSRRSGSYDLPFLSADSDLAFARDVNESNVAVGYEFGASFGYRALLWPPAGGVTEPIDGTACNFGSLSFGRPEGINEAGTIVAHVRRVDEAGSCRTLWLLHRASGEEFLGPQGRPAAINRHEVVVGVSGVNPVKWSTVGGVVPLAALDGNVEFGSATDINDREEVVGYVERLDPDTLCPISAVSKLWDADGTAHDLPGLPTAHSTYAFGIDNRGNAVGYGEFAVCGEPTFMPLSRAVVWHHGRIRDLNDLIPRRLGITLISASDINSRGQIVTHGYRNAEPLRACPYLEFDPNTGEPVYNDTPRCPNLYSFLLTPVHD